MHDQESEYTTVKDLGKKQHSDLTGIPEEESENLRAIEFVEREVGGTTLHKLSACIPFKSILPKP